MKDIEKIKLIETLKKAKAYAYESTADDGGTCNLDHCVIFIKGLTEKTAKELETASGVIFSKWNAGEWHLYGYMQGQANRRADMATRFYHVMKDNGYMVYLYQQMD